MEPKKRGRGRPAGSKDSKPRVYRKSTILEMETEDGFDPNGLLSVEDQIRRIEAPCPSQHIVRNQRTERSDVAEEKIEQGKLRAFKRSGIILIEPKDFLEYWPFRKAFTTDCWRKIAIALIDHQGGVLSANACGC